MKTLKKYKKNILYGYQSVKFAIKKRKENIKKLFITKKKYEEVFEEGWLEGYKNIEFVTKEDMDLITGSIHHNSIGAEIKEYGNFISNIDQLGSRVLILDNITDSGNLGAIIRSAAVFGYDLILQNSNSPEINGATGKNSAGGLEFISIFYTGSLLQTIRQLKKNYYFVIGASEKENHIPSILEKESLPEKVCLIMGAEDKGIRGSLLEELDFVYKINGNSSFNVLNVSVSTGIILSNLYNFSMNEKKIKKEMF